MKKRPKEKWDLCCAPLRFLFENDVVEAVEGFFLVEDYFPPLHRVGVVRHFRFVRTFQQWRRGTKFGSCPFCDTDLIQPTHLDLADGRNIDLPHGVKPHKDADRVFLHHADGFMESMERDLEKTMKRAAPRKRKTVGTS